MGDLRAVWDQVGREVEDVLGDIRHLPVLSTVQPAQLRRAIESRFAFTEPIPLEDLTRQVADLLRRYTVHVTHPRYFGLFIPASRRQPSRWIRGRCGRPSMPIRRGGSVRCSSSGLLARPAEASWIRWPTSLMSPPHLVRGCTSMPRGAARPRWSLGCGQTVLPLVCFTHEDIRTGQLKTDAVVRLLQDRGRVWISDVVLGQRERVLRACITSFRTDEEDLDVLVDEIEHARRHCLSSSWT